MCAAIVQSAAPATEEILDQIVGLVRKRGLQVGEQLPPIRELSRLLGKNATAVRDALLHAQARGLVKVLPRAGAFVQKTSLEPDEMNLGRLAADCGLVLSGGDHNLFHLLDARRLIEMELAARAVEVRRMEDLDPVRRTLEQMAGIHQIERRANYVALDIQFHVQMARLGQNPVLADILATLLDKLRPQLERLPWSAARRQETDQSHARLYKSLVDGKKAPLCKELNQHLQTAYDALLKQLRTPPAVTDMVRNRW
jgi:DNA-binding FadR family transcriptional regulator